MSYFAKFLSSTSQGDSPSTMPGERIYAIGDVHGCYAELRELLAKIEAHSAALPNPRCLRLIAMGDLIDRGPRSSEVIRFLRNVQQRTPRLEVLMGNHEELLLKVLDREISAQRTWLKVGGLETLSSFGVEPPRDGEHPWKLAERLYEAIGTELVQWIRDLPLTAHSGEYLFCHAGVRPGTKLSRQSPKDLLWIRDEFLEDESDHGKVIVHGHSRTFEVDVRANRIGIDTGAYHTGRLSALYLEGDQLEVLHTGDGEAAVAFGQ